MNTIAENILSNVVELAEQRQGINHQVSQSGLAEKQKELLTRLPRGWTGDEIMTAIFPPTRWAVNDLIPTGAILLSGTFKIGKSWMMLQLADSVSRGKPFLGHETTCGAVLYLALEDGPVRIQRRAKKMGITLSKDIHVFNTWLSGDDGLQSLEAWLAVNPVRLIIIDTLSRWQDDFRGTDIWMRDTKRIADLKSIADLYENTVLIVHHRSKAAREDPHQSVAGTNAIQGAADGSILLDKKRNENTAKLSMVGRDIPEGEMAIEFIQESCTWRALNVDPTELELSAERRAILDAIRELGGKAMPGQIAEKLGKERSSISHILAKMSSEGVVSSVSYGTYAIVIPLHTDHTDHTIPTIENGTVNTVNTVIVTPTDEAESNLDIF